MTLPGILGTMVALYGHSYAIVPWYEYVHVYYYVPLGTPWYSRF
jgi:hypothetical protein